MTRGTRGVIRPVVIPSNPKKPFDTIREQNREMQIEMSLFQALLDIIVGLRLNDGEMMARSEAGQVALDCRSRQAKELLSLDRQ